MQLRGVIEGFYGPPWSWAERMSLLEWAIPRGLVDYVYAPKDDPKHRSEWRTPYTAEELHGFADLGAIDGAQVWFAVSPGLSMTYGDADDRRTLVAKFTDLVDHGVHGFCLAVDDLPPTPGLGAAHGDLAAFLVEELDAPLLLVPTDYTSTAPTTYLRELADTCPEEVPIGWTGSTVVCDTITAAEAAARTAALGGRKPWLWDNYPVNDALMDDRLFTGPLRGRDPALAGMLCGYVANGGVQPRSSRPAFASIAAWLDGDDPVTAWDTFVDDADWRIFSEACDGHVPNRLAADVVAGRDDGAAREWFAAAAETMPPGLEDEAAPWIEQLHREAAVAVAVLDAGDDPAVLTTALLPWLGMARPRHSVLGARRAFRPVFGQDDLGGFVARAGAIQAGPNALDVLAHGALAVTQTTPLTD